jgi:four helix bundle protein
MADVSNAERVAQLKARVFAFVCQVMSACPSWRALEIRDQAAWKQLTRAALSVALNFEEADSASSRADFIARTRIVLREAKECVLCIRVIRACRLGNHERAAHLLDEASQLAAIFGAIVRNTIRNLEATKSHPSSARSRKN